MKNWSNRIGSSIVIRLSSATISMRGFKKNFDCLVFSFLSENGFTTKSPLTGSWEFIWKNSLEKCFDLSSLTMRIPSDAWCLRTTWTNIVEWIVPARIGSALNWLINYSSLANNWLPLEIQSYKKYENFRQDMPQEAARGHSMKVFYITDPFCRAKDEPLVE